MVAQQQLEADAAGQHTADFRRDLTFWDWTAVGASGRLRRYTVRYSRRENYEHGRATAGQG